MVFWWIRDFLASHQIILVSNVAHFGSSSQWSVGQSILFTPFGKCISFQTWLFLVSMLDFRGVPAPKLGEIDVGIHMPAPLSVCWDDFLFPVRWSQGSCRFTEIVKMGRLSSFHVVISVQVNLRIQTPPENSYRIDGLNIPSI